MDLLQETKDFRELIEKGGLDNPILSEALLELLDEVINELEEKPLSKQLLEVQMVLEDCVEQKTSLHWIELGSLISQINQVRQELKRTDL